MMKQHKHATTKIQFCYKKKEKKDKSSCVCVCVWNPLKVDRVDMSKKRSKQFGVFFYKRRCGSREIEKRFNQ